MSQCWICGHEYVTDYCTKCGPPERWGPTPEEMLAVLKKLAEENDEDRDDEC